MGESDASLFSNFTQLGLSAWARHETLVPVGMSLILLFMLLAVSRESVGSGEDSKGYVGIFFQSLFCVLILTNFKVLIEGLKDLMWAVESTINSGQTIELTLANLQRSKALEIAMESEKSFSIWTWLVTATFEAINWCADVVFSLFQLVWIFLVIIAPIVIPLMLFPLLGGILKGYIYIVVFLLIVRIPWAILSSFLNGLGRSLSEAGFSFGNATFFTIGTGLTVVSPFLVIKLIPFAAPALASAASSLGAVAAPALKGLGVAGLAGAAKKGFIGKGAQVSAKEFMSSPKEGISALQQNKSLRMSEFMDSESLSAVDQLSANMPVSGKNQILQSAIQMKQGEAVKEALNPKEKMEHQENMELMGSEFLNNESRNAVSELTLGMSVAGQNEALKTAVNFKKGDAVKGALRRIENDKSPTGSKYSGSSTKANPRNSSSSDSIKKVDFNDNKYSQESPKANTRTDFLKENKRLDKKAKVRKKEIDIWK